MACKRILDRANFVGGAKMIDEARAINIAVTARFRSPYILLFVASDQTEAGNFIPSNEIYLSIADVHKLEDMAKAIEAAREVTNELR